MLQYTLYVHNVHTMSENKNKLFSIKKCPSTAHVLLSFYTVDEMLNEPTATTTKSRK